MNRFAYDNIDSSVTSQQREKVLTPNKRRWTKKAKPGVNKPEGRDERAGKKLEARVRQWEAMDSKKQAASTRPGSMQR